jgi:hypothetical protein
MTDEELQRLLAEPAVWAEPAPDLEDRVVAAIAAAAAPSHQPRLVTTAPPAVLDEPPATDELARRRSRRLRYAILGAAAAVVVAAGLAIGLIVGRGSSTRSEQFAAALSASDLAPSARGQATLTKTVGGWRIEINASGLPRRDNGRYYEAWLKNSAGLLVPIGTFNEPRDVTLWSGAAPTDFPTLTITRQVVGQSQQSSGQVVLSGPTHRIH